MVLLHASLPIRRIPLANHLANPLVRRWLSPKTAFDKVYSLAAVTLFWVLFPSMPTMAFGAATPDKPQSPDQTMLQHDEGSQGQLDGRIIDSISIQNSRGRTRGAFVVHKLRLREGQPFFAQQLDEGLQRLRDTRIFKTVSGQAFGRGDKVHIELILEEKWTTLPDLRFGGGGGTSYFRAGVFDINWFGLGGQGLIAYENRNGTNNGDAWLRYPNAFDTGHLLGGGISRTTTLLTDYGPNRQVAGGQAMSKTTLLVDYEYAFTNWLIFGYRMEPEWVSFNDEQIASNVQQANDAAGRRPSPATRRTLHRVQWRLTNLHYEGVLTEGMELTLQALPAFKEFASDSDLLLTRSDLRAFAILPREWNLAGRLTLRTSSDSRPENTHRMGGLTEIRGYFDGEFVGRYALYSSLEVRKNLFSTWSFVWQPAVFYDFGVVANSWQPLWSQKLRDGIGLGLRVAPDFVHLATFRLDYAWGLSDRRNEGGLSFGVLHFL
jgi:hypothetical protein